MGYDIHITRTVDRFDSEKKPITFEEWIALVRSDPEFHLTGEATAVTPNGQRITMKAPGLTEWTSTSSARKTWFLHHMGKVTVTNPEPEILDKMRQVAKTLAARVQGDEGEFYDIES